MLVIGMELQDLEKATVGADRQLQRHLAEGVVLLEELPDQYRKQVEDQKIGPEQRQLAVLRAGLASTIDRLNVLLSGVPLEEDFYTVDALSGLSQKEAQDEQQRRLMNAFSPANTLRSLSSMKPKDHKAALQATLRALAEEEASLRLRVGLNDRACALLPTFLDATEKLEERDASSET